MIDCLLPRRLCVLIAACALTACDNPLDSEEPPQVIALNVAANDHPLVRIATVTLDRPGAVTLTWSAERAPALTLTSDRDSTTYTVVLPRLRERRTYDLVATASRGDRVGAPRNTSFATGPLPADVAGIRFIASGTPTHDVSIVEVVTATTGFIGVLFVEEGEVVWYHRTLGSLFGTTRRTNGDLVLLDPTLGLVSMRLDATIAHRLPQPDSAPAAQYGRIHHDAVATPGNTILFIANETRAVGDTAVVGEALWEWSPETGAVQKRWSAFDHLRWSTDRTTRSDPTNWLHGNGLAFGPRGNVIMSLRNIDQVLSIAPDFRTVEWRFGGPGATMSAAGGDAFLGQHGASEPAPGRLLVFDNGFERPGTRYSRAVEYSVAANAPTAPRIWQFRPAPDIYASLVGSARRLFNGNTVVLFGMLGGQIGSTGPIVAMEVDLTGTERWRLAVTGGATRLYRVTQVASLAGESKQ